jgi:hypothetical protein
MMVPIKLCEMRSRMDVWEDEGDEEVAGEEELDAMS